MNIKKFNKNIVQENIFLDSYKQQHLLILMTNDRILYSQCIYIHTYVITLITHILQAKRRYYTESMEDFQRNI